MLLVYLVTYPDIYYCDEVYIMLPNLMLSLNEYKEKVIF